MSGLIILILIFIGIPLLWRGLKPYFFRWAQHRTEDYVRKSMGMPPRDKSRSRRSNAYNSSSSSASSSYGRRRPHYHSGPIIPKEYAVDVEYTEIKSYSSEEVIGSDGRNVRYSVESQVSDAEILEIRKDR